MTWIWSNLDLIWDRTLDHLVLSVPPIVFSFLIALPLGWLANRYRLSRGVILTVSGLLYAIPSLPLFFVLPAIVGTSLRSPLNLVIALTLYGVALMVRVVADGLASVDADVRQSAVALGYSGWSIFWQVELPLSGPVLLAGLRVVAVSTVSLATVGAVIGAQSLGSLFTDGFQRGIEAEIIAGIVATVLVALLLDGALVVLGRVALPWTRPAGSNGAAAREARIVEVTT
ncbi:ABC transporter permease [Cryobacterium sp. TMT1-21]|uniref:ABC transporter permease n=1 Tax=Cryobacterium shii TaxID=1259235 RepID=A0AAQ2HFL5_9MICO|nr:MULTISPECIES: ABC transporter permease [Cryobacterium]TFC45864.1 ABC transporter permease [Cryobacterium shii]TFD08722.1 ABC transporter permease [Cryobacterium sp. TMT1-21]TFD18511.1 ABC transporter permease [Cryobacterium sp. TMT4-10]TFD26295.1 ABC transporter permease [Cryobacterium sp. TMT2-23]TFD40549.1 ABC transporter permease [Cryobacterium sp. TMT2-10]